MTQNTETVTAELAFTKETKNKARFDEQGDREQHKVGNLYIDKRDYERMGRPSTVQVTVQSAE